MTLITAPFERIKVILQVQDQQCQSSSSQSPKHKNAAAVVRHLYRTGGIPSIYKGSLATLARDGPGSAAYFAAYEAIKAALTSHNPPSPDGKPPRLSLGAITCAGAAAGVAMWIPVFPVDTIKSRIQTAEANLSVSTVVRQLYSQGGVRAFFPGFGPALARAVPANAATFLGVELAHQAMNSLLGPP
ncbi:hypothetical protein CDD80_7608 [Ophiocordyceps camponoti-rufipedis]|uniref:Mitochondrial carrier protein n=1 Tax=Ophiocordyceps camponoti-rufipedis TaxID=2004952 RepID=A0A2C5YN16_9HYPO|nr:hypothetical protein CDD80_7608 [Ophiocordyceps camponoti-rufipedis]